MPRPISSVLCSFADPLSEGQKFNQGKSILVAQAGPLSRATPRNLSEAEPGNRVPQVRLPFRGFAFLMSAIVPDAAVTWATWIVCVIFQRLRTAFPPLAVEQEREDTQHQRGIRPSSLIPFDSFPFSRNFGTKIAGSITPSIS